MSPEAQRIAIAEACGWKRFHEHNGHLRGFIGLDSSLRLVPDFLNDLNAIHEAEKALGRDVLVCAFTKALEDVIKNGCRVADFSTYPSDMIWHATAAQRAEAFLRTINKWEDSK